MEWFSTLSLALGSAWTSGINLYATVSVLGLLQKFGSVKLPGLAGCARQLVDHRICGRTLPDRVFCRQDTLR